MKEQEEIIELHLMNTDIWKEFIKEPKQNKSICYLQNIEIKIYEVQAKTYFFTAKGDYELFDHKKPFQIKAKAILLKNDTVKSVHKVKEEKINLSLIKDTMKTKLQFQAKVLTILVAIICLPFLATAQWSAPINLSPAAHSAGLNESMGSCLGVSGDTIHVIWCDKHTSTHSALYYSRSVDTGLTWSAPINITDTSSNDWNPAIAVNGNNVHVVWRYIDPVSGKRSSWYKHSIDGGNTWAANILLDTAIADWPAVAVSGNIVYVANDYVTSQMPYNTEIFFLRSTDNGLTWSPHQQLSFAVNRSEDEAITAQGSHVHMSWNDKRSGQFQIFYKESADYGVTWGPDLMVTPQYDYSTMVSVDGAHVDVVSAGSTSGNHYQILLNQSADTGATWAAPMNITTDTLNTFFYPDMVRNGNDLHVVCGGSNGAKYMHSADGGTTWDVPYSFTGNSTFVAYTGCAVHIIYVDALHKIRYMRNPTANSGHCGTTVGINNKEEVGIKTIVYPNPFASQTTIEISSSEKMENLILKVYNIVGQEIMSKNFGTDNKIVIGKEKLTSGIYFYKIIEKEKVISIGKLVAQ